MFRSRRTRHHRLAATSVVASALLLSACSPWLAPDRLPTNEVSPIEPQDPQHSTGRGASGIAPLAGPPLPDGSYYSPAGSFKPKPPPNTQARASYRPDDSTPRERIPDIVKRGRLIVGVDQSNNLLSYRDSVTGSLQGFEVDIAHEIAEDIFGDRNRVDFRFIQSAEREEALINGTVDVVVRTMSITPERQRKVDFSIPYLSGNVRMLVLNSSGISTVEDTSGRTICATVGSTALDRARANAPNANVLVTRSWGDCLMSLQLGQVDAIIVDDTLLSGMLDQDPYTSIVGDVLDQENYGVGIKRAEDGSDTRGLIRQVNVTMERIRRDGTWDRLFEKWFGAYLSEPELPAPRYLSEDEEFQPAKEKDSPEVRGDD